MGTIERAPLVAPKRRSSPLIIAVPILVLIAAATFLFVRKRAESARVEADKASAEKMRSVYQAGKEIEAATSVGVNKLRFPELLSKFSAEVGILRDHATTAKEKRVVDLYANVAATYQDSMLVWNMEAASNEFRPYDPPMAYILARLMPRECAAVAKYKLPVHIGHEGGEDGHILRGYPGMDWEHSFGNPRIDPKECVAEIWTQASEQLRGAEAEVNAMAHLSP